MDRDSYPRAAKAAEREPGGFDARGVLRRPVGFNGAQLHPLTVLAAEHGPIVTWTHRADVVPA
jgi:hypothetical protein